MKWISASILLISMALFFVVLNATLARPTKEALMAKLREIRVFKWNIEIAGAFLEAALEAVLAVKTLTASRLRLVASSLLLLTMSLGAIGWRTDTLLGLTDAPWDHYEKVAAQFGAVSENERIDPRAPNAREQFEARRALAERAEKARAPAWKYVYTVVVIAWIAFVNHIMLFLSVLATVHFVREIRTSPSWTQRLGLIVLLSIVTIVLGNVALFVVGLLHNPAAWVTVILGKSFGLATVVLLVIGSNLFAWFVSDPWLSALIVAPLLPAIALLLLVVPALLSDGKEWLTRGANKLVLHTILSRLGAQGISLLITLLTLMAIIAALSLLPLRP